MAKRRRLSPLPEPLQPVEGDEPAPRRSVPIADMAGASSASAAAAEMSQALKTAREEGRMVLVLPLEAVEQDYLVRDRVTVDAENMAALKASIAARGQQTPIEVADLGQGRYGLISGWRRLTALGELHAETADARFATVDALLRRPDHSADAYLAMVEENEIRAGLSYYERARIVLRAAEQGVFPTILDALQGLFANASRPRRSKIGSFVPIVSALDGAVRHPRAIGERLGLKLSKALEGDPELGDRLRRDLVTDPADTPESELARLEAALVTGPASRKARPAPRRATPAKGVTLTVHHDGRIEIRGARVDADLAARLEAWLGQEK